MATSAFGDRSAMPDDDSLREVLGGAAALWEALRAAVAAAYPPLDAAWVWGGAPYGWSLRLKQRKRAVLYLTPCRGSFRAALALGEKAAGAAAAAGLPARLLDAIAAAPRFPEGRAVRLEVRDERDVADTLAVAALKMRH